jgi:hypothetical protein
MASNLNLRVVLGHFNTARRLVMRKGLLVLAALIPMVLSACATSATGPRSAGDDGDCRSGYIMSGGRCVEEPGGG